MGTLYELTDACMALLEAVSNAEDAGEVELLLRNLDDANDKWTEKAENYARFLREIEVRSEAAKNEADRLTARKKKLDILAEGLKARMMISMKALNLTTAETTIGTWKIGKGRESVQIIDAAKVPDEYLIHPAPTVSKTAVMAAYKATGEIIPGCEIVRNETFGLK